MHQVENRVGFCPFLEAEDHSRLLQNFDCLLKVVNLGKDRRQKDAKVTQLLHERDLREHFGL